MTRLFVSWTMLLIAAKDVTAVQAVTVSQAQSRTTSAVLNAKAEAVEDSKAGTVLSDETRFMRKSIYAEDANEKNATAAKVDIDVYYETRCPGCLLFLNKTLEPLWRKPNLREVFNIKLYTYGNGMTVPLENISEGYKFWHPESTGAGWRTVQICQHGGDECFGNLVQVCAQNVSSAEKHMDLVFCMTGTTIDGYGVEKASYECMDKVGIDKDKVRDCVTSPKGNQLLTAVGAKTHELKGRKGTPWVMVGGQHVEDAVLMNSTLLLQSVCSIAKNVPVPCTPFQHMAAPAAAAPASSVDPDFTVLEDTEKADLLKVSSV